MSKQIKKNCQLIMTQMQSKLLELRQSLKLKRIHSISQKILNQIINQFKFLRDDFKLILHHLSTVQNQSLQKDLLIGKLQQQIMNKNEEKKITELMLRQKYQKTIKQIKFMEFSGKNKKTFKPTHQRTKSQFIKRGLNQLEKDILETNFRVCNKVKLMRNQIQNQQLRYQTLQNNQYTIKIQNNPIISQQYQNIISPKIQFDNLDFSDILIQDKFSPQRNIKHQKSKDLLHLDDKFMKQNLRTKKKCYDLQVQIQNDQTGNKSKSTNQQKNINQQKNGNSLNLKSKSKLMESGSLEKIINQKRGLEERKTQTQNQHPVKLNKKKKEQLAQLIAKQAKIIVTKDKYFSTDF